MLLQPGLPMPLTPADPSTIGPFTVTGRLGAGGMGVVYHGTDDARGTEVAIKVMAPGVPAEVRRRMEQEARLLRRAHHPGIPRLVAEDLAADPPWLAMTYVPGPGLHQAQVPLDDGSLRRLATGLAGALAALHAAGVVHRDVKPSNIILAHDGPALVDLGIARADDHEPLTRTGVVIGSPGWMPPEQLLDRPVGPWTDVWSWGAVMTYAATGRPPYGSGPLEAMSWRVLHTEPDLSGLPPWLRPAVLGALSPDPAARPRADQLPAGGPPESPATDPPTSTHLRSRRPRTLWTVAVLAALAVIGTVVGLREAAGVGLREAAGVGLRGAAGAALPAPVPSAAALSAPVPSAARGTGFRLERSWRESVHVASGPTWATLADDPAAAGCTGQRFTFRWRDVAGPPVQATVLSAAGTGSAGTTGPRLRGWMSAGGCARPGFRLPAGATGQALLTVEIEQWVHG